MTPRMGSWNRKKKKKKKDTRGKKPEILVKEFKWEILETTQNILILC